MISQALNAQFIYCMSGKNFEMYKMCLNTYIKGEQKHFKIKTVSFFIEMNSNDRLMIFSQLFDRTILNFRLYMLNRYMKINL